MEYSPIFFPLCRLEHIYGAAQRISAGIPAVALSERVSVVESLRSLLVCVYLSPFQANGFLFVCNGAEQGLICYLQEIKG